MSRINLKNVSALSFLSIVMMINVILPNIALSQSKYYTESWIQGHVTSLSKDYITVDNIRYQFDILLSIRDSNGNVLEPVALKKAEIVKILERNGKAMKIVIVKFRR